MIESLENVLHLVILLLCAGVSVYRAASTGEKAWVVLAFYFGSWILGDLYWLAYLFFYDRSPRLEAVSDLSWYASYILLYLLMQHVTTPEIKQEKALLPWLAPVFTAGMALFYMQYGKYVSNAVTAVLVALLLYNALRGLVYVRRHGPDRRKRLYAAVLIYCLLEYASWTASCFVADYESFNAYYLFDTLVALSLLLLLPATKRAVSV